MTIAERLAGFGASLRFEALPPAVVDSVRLRTLDLLGTALAATGLEAGAALAPAVARWTGEGPCTVIGAKSGAVPPLAALLNGALAHALDFDDTHPASITHASAVVLPAVLALAESEGADGRTVITAAVAGYETVVRLGLAAPGAFHARGWHATSACGTFAAALAAGRLLGLEAGRLAGALGLAGSFASGVLEYLADGSWSKRAHAGWAAHAGVVAATLAAGGFLGPSTILEGRFGVYPAMLGTVPAAEPFESLGRHWHTLEIAFKAYPCCHYLHAFLDGVLALRRAHGLEAADVAAVECGVPPGQVPIVCEPRAAKVAPRSVYDAQFSLPFAVASALLDGRVDVETFTPARLGDAARQALATRVTHVEDPALASARGFSGWVRITTRGGRVLQARDLDGGRPLTPAAVIEKFRDNAARALPAARVPALERAALALDALADAGILLRLCRP